MEELINMVSKMLTVLYLNGYVDEYEKAEKKEGTDNV